MALTGGTRLGTPPLSGDGKLYIVGYSDGMGVPALEPHLACESRILLGLSGDRARFAAEDPSPAT